MKKKLEVYLKETPAAVFLLRHGHIDTGGERRLVGQTDYPLSPLGRQQAEACRQFLQEIPFTAIIASGLTRARETAEIIAGGRSSPVRVEPGLNEINLGDWENINIQQAEQANPQVFRALGESVAAFSPPHGESFAELQRRVLPVFLPLFEDRSGHVLVVAHAGVNRVILCHLLGMPLDNLFRLEQDYGALHILATGHRKYHVLALNLRPD